MTNGFVTASSLLQTRQHCHSNVFASCGESDSEPRMSGPTEAEISRIQNLILSGCHDEAMRIAQQFYDPSIARFVCSASEQTRIRQWRARENVNGVGILPTREGIMAAGAIGDDIKCAQLLDAMYKLPTNDRFMAPSGSEMMTLVVQTCQHWMLRTANKLREFRVLDKIDTQTFFRMLEHSFLPLVRHVARTPRFADRIAKLAPSDRSELCSRYAHCGLRFCIRYSLDLEKIRQAHESPHIISLSDEDFVGFCRYRNLLSHMSDAEVIDRRAMIGTPDYDPVASARLFTDVVDKPWSEQFSLLFDALFNARVPAGRERENLRQFTDIAITPPSSTSDAVVSMAA